MNKTEFQILINDLLDLYETNKDFDEIDKVEIAKLIFNVESKLQSIREPLKIPVYNPAYFTEQIVKDFHNHHKPFRPIDYQYYMLGYLLEQTFEIEKKKLVLYQILEGFTDRIKNESFHKEDVEVTASGRTRCNTNMRFAMQFLKDAGLLKSHQVYSSVDERIAVKYNHPRSEPKDKNLWTLSYIGFFVAAHLCLQTNDDGKKPWSTKMYQAVASDYYFKIDPVIFKSIHELSKPDSFNKLIKKIHKEALGLSMLENAPSLFGKYLQIIDRFESLPAAERDRQKNHIYHQIELLETRNMLDDFMQQLSTRISIDKIFAELKK